MREKLLKSRGKALLCECGCGNPVTWNKRKRCWNKYICNHHCRGKKLSTEHRAKIGASEKGKKHHFFGKHFSAEHRAKLSESLKKKFANPENNPFFGKHHSKETRRKLIESLMGRKLSAEIRRKLSGQNSAHWIDGRSRKRYPPELTQNYLQAIRRRDNFTCQFCGRKRKAGQHRLEVHHIDCDPKRRDNHPSNLITLCKSCHKDTQTNKTAWQRVYTNLMKKIKRQNPEGHRAAIKIYEQNMRVFYKSKVA